MGVRKFTQETGQDRGLACFKSFYRKDGARRSDVLQLTEICSSPDRIEIAITLSDGSALGQLSDPQGACLCGFESAFGFCKVDFKDTIGCIGATGSNWGHEDIVKEIHIAVVSSEVVMSQSLEKVLTQQFKQYQDETELKLKIFTQLPSVEDAIVHFSPRIVIVCIGKTDRDDKINFLGQLSRVAARIPIVVCAMGLESEMILACVKRGVSDFIKYPLDEIEIRDALARLLEKSIATSKDQKLGSIYTFFSYKGGVGTTFLATNTAVALAKSTGKPTLIWDMVLQNGDVPFFLDHEPKMTLKELVNEIDSIDDPFLHSALPPHESGVSILAAPRSPEEADSITHEQVQQMYSILRKHYEYIIVDGGHAFTDPVISVMDASHYIVFPTDLHLPVLKNTLRCIGIFEKFGYVEEKFKIVINRYNSKYEEVDLSKAEKILPYPIAFTFANEYMTVSRSLNTGIPLAELDKKSMLTKQFYEFAKLLVEGFESRKTARGNKFGGFFGGKKGK